MNRKTRAVVRILGLAVAVLFGATSFAGVTVNGQPVTSSPLVLDGSGPYVLSGGDSNLRVEVRSNAKVILSNLNLYAQGTMAGVLAFHEGVTAELVLEGSNEIGGNGGYYNLNGAAVYVDKTASLTIRSAEGQTGELHASGGRWGAGIGGYCNSSGKITILSGRIIVEANEQAAAIGAGDGNTDPVASYGDITIAGGYVKAICTDSYGSAVGAGHNCKGGGTIKVTGGTLHAYRVYNTSGTADIGWVRALESGSSASVQITGGSVRAGSLAIYPTPTDGSQRVWCVTLPVSTAEAPHVITGWGNGREYSFTDVYPIDGKAYLWLPNGEYTFQTTSGSGKRYYTATVSDAAVTAKEFSLPDDETGVKVNGHDVVLAERFPNENCTYNGGILILRGQGPYVLSGTNVEGKVHVDVTADARIVLSNLVLSGFGSRQIAGIYVDNGRKPTIELQGVSRLDGGASRPAVEVQYNSTLTLCGDGALAATAGEGADIVGRYTGWASGTVSYIGGRYSFVPPSVQVPSGYLVYEIDETVGGERMIRKVSAFTPLGVAVNGQDVALKAGDGWTFDVNKSILHLTGSGPYVLSGSNGQNGLQILQEENAVVTFSNLVLRAVDDRSCYVVDWRLKDVAIRLYGANELLAYPGHGAGVEVREGADVTFAAAPGLTDGEATLVATGGDYAAGIGGIGDSLAGIIRIQSGTIRAQGGYGAAGIGVGQTRGVHGSYATKVYVSGGRVTATGGMSGAGIGTGFNCWYGSGADIGISGGYVRATGGVNAAGIGGGSDSVMTSENHVTISGGTVEASYGPDSSTACDDIGAGYHRNFAGLVRLTGGNILCEHAQVAKPTSNPPHAVSLTLPGAAAGLTPVTVAGLPSDYGINDVFAVDGRLCFWLPTGTYDFTVAGRRYVAAVSGTDVEAQEWQEQTVTSFYVDGTDVGVGVGYGWNWRAANGELTFTASDRHELSGTSCDGCVNVVLPANLTVGLRFDRATLTSAPNAAAFSGEGSLTALGGTLVVTGGVDCAWRVTGGSLWVDDFSVAPSNALSRVWRVVVPLAADVEDGRAVSVERLPETYDVRGICPVGGRLCFWLPDGDYDFLIAGNQSYRVTVAGADATAEPYTPEVPPVETGLFVDGVDVGEYVGQGWTWNPVSSNLLLNETREYMLACTTSVSAVSLVLPSNVVAGVFFTNVVSLAGGVSGEGQLTVNGGTAQIAGDVTCAMRILGGSFRADFLCVAPSNGEERVWCVTVPIADGGVQFAGLPASYVTRGIVAVDGRVSLWLPNGVYRFIANGVHYRAEVADAPVTAEAYEPDYAVDAVKGVVTSSYEYVTDAVLSGERHLVLRRDVTNETLRFSCLTDFTIEGGGHVLRPNLATGASYVFSVASNATVRLENVVFDGTDSSTAVSNSEITVFAEVSPCGRLELDRCQIRGFRFAEAVVRAMGAERTLTPEAYPACQMADAEFLDNQTPISFVVHAGVTLEGDYTNRIVRLSEDARVAVRGDVLEGDLILDLLDARKRLGDVIVTNAFGSVVEAINVRIAAAGYAAFGKGNVTLGLTTDHPFVVTYGEEYGTYGTFAEARAAALHAGSNRVDLLYYVNAPLGVTYSRVERDVTIADGDVAALGTVRRETPDGTNTFWTLNPSVTAALAGTLRVEGTLELGNVACERPIELATSGVIRVTAECPLAAQVYRVSFERAETAVGCVFVTSDVWSPEQLKASFRVSNVGWTFLPVAGEGLRLVRVEPCVARLGHTMFYGSLDEALTVAENGETLSLVAVTNVTTGAFSNRVEIGTGARVPSGCTLTLGSICRRTEGDAVTWDDSASAVLVCTPDAPLAIETNAVLKLADVSVTGVLALSGDGLLDLGGYSGGQIAVRPSRYGRIALGANAAKLRLADGVSGVLRFADDGTCRYGTGVVAFDFEQTGNGSGRITVNDDGNVSHVEVSGKTGDQTYVYVSADGSVTNLFSYGVIQYDTKACKFNSLPSEATYEPRYLNQSGAWEKFTSKNVPNNNISVEDNGDIHLRCNGKAFTLSGLGYSKEEKKAKIGSVTSVISHILSLSGALVGVAGAASFFKALVDTAEITTLTGALESFFGLAFDALGIIANALAFVDYVYNIFFRAFAALYYNGTYYQMSDVPAAIQQNIKDNEAGNYENTVYTLRNVRLDEPLVCQSYGDGKHGYLVWDGNCDDLMKSANGILYNYDFYKAQSGLSNFEEIMSVFDYSTIPGIGKRLVTAMELAMRQSQGPHEFGFEKGASQPALIVTDNAEARIKNFTFNSKSLTKSPQGPYVRVENSGVLSMNKVKITGHDSVGAEGFVHVQQGGVFELSGESEIKDNKVTAAAVVVDAGGDVWLSEKATIAGNVRADGKLSNLSVNGASVHIGKAEHAECGWHFPHQASKYEKLEGQVGFSGRSAGEPFGVDDFKQGAAAWATIVPDGGTKNLKLQVDAANYVSYVLITEWKDPDDYTGTEAEKVYQAMIANGFPPVVAELITTKAAYQSLKEWAERRKLALASVTKAELPIVSAAFDAEDVLTNDVSLTVSGFDQTASGGVTLRIEVEAGHLQLADRLLATCAVTAEGTESLTNAFDRTKVKVGETRYVEPTGGKPYVEVPVIPNLAVPYDQFFFRSVVH